MKTLCMVLLTVSSLVCVSSTLSADWTQFRGPGGSATSETEDDNSRTNASPVVSNGQLLIRNDRYLYCLGKR